MPLKFKHIRKYLAVYDQVSVCIHETGDYENFFEARSIPEKYDDMYLYGIGKYESLFINHDGEEVWLSCTEIRLSYTPRFGNTEDKNND